MFVLLGILLIFFIIIVEYFLGVYAGFTVLGFNISAVVPLGCYFVGLIIATVLAEGIKKSGRKINKFHYVFAIIVAGTTFFASGFVWYRATYIDSTYGFNESRIGVPMRKLEFVDINGKKIDMTYTNYFTYDLYKIPEQLEKGSTIIVKSKEVQKVPTYLIKFITLMLSTVLSLKAIMYNQLYCENCKKYYRNKTLFKIAGTKYHSEISELRHRLREHDNLKEYVNKKRGKLREHNFYKVQLRYCKSCESGRVAIREYELENLRVIENKENIQYIDIDNEAVSQIL